MLHFPKEISRGATDRTDVHTIALPAIFLENCRMSDPRLGFLLRTSCECANPSASTTSSSPLSKAEGGAVRYGSNGKSLRHPSGGGYGLRKKRVVDTKRLEAVCSTTVAKATTAGLWREKTRNSFGAPRGRGVFARCHGALGSSYCTLQDVNYSSLCAIVALLALPDVVKSDY